MTAPVQWTTEVHRDTAAFEALAEEWDDLLDRCAPATPFQSHAWLCSWWQSYGRPGTLRLVTVRRGELLVAAAPLMVRHRLLPRLVPIGFGLTDFLDVLVDDEHADQAAAFLVRTLGRELGLTRPWAVVDLRELRPDAAAQHLVAHWPGAARTLPDSMCQHLPGVPVEELLGRLPGRTAQRTRVKLRRLVEAGVETRQVPPEEVPAAVGELLTLHELQWRGRGATPEHLRDRFAEHLRRAAGRMTATDRALIRQYRLDGRLIASDLQLHGPDLAALYFYGVHPEARDRIDIAGMLFRESLADAAEAGRSEVSLLRGDEPYKQRWRPDRAGNQRLLLGGGPAVALYAAGARLRRTVLRSLRARAPWLAAVRARLRTLRG
ncbi:GNAT family N-acetyltransferase [Streptacidiphilus sp. PB12-B1b]|uniref:GNAT family N-acetyltransferase n=1 Tax=Streptacidiphilus sp. PB12-B1b TaxID=2705012 RepID=UPI0015FDB428|nr:GNAT family N-acetyltransferase [Streptacidiphilus sp. PB12-B1b]QMU78528.1 GNAT family N-acetyltransferase [Streptacidiphilus sp. PB12-B1b]